MFTISDSVHINAPIERCFLLSTNIELVGRTLGMKPIEGKTSGLIESGDRLLWAGWKFGFPQMHESLITKFERPTFFQDTMGRGRFRRFQHDHHLYYMDGRTVLNDKLRFTMPFGWLGGLGGAFCVGAAHLAAAAKEDASAEEGGRERRVAAVCAGECSLEQRRISIERAWQDLHLTP